MSVRKRGFSLIELLIVLSIIAVIATFGIISFTSFQQKAQAQLLQSQLLRAIQLTRNEAILRHELTLLCHSRDQLTCSGNWQDGFIVKTTERVIYGFQSSFSEKGILHWRAFPRGREQLEFLPTGFPHAENGSFWFCAANALYPAWAIMLNKAGRARVSLPNSQGIILDHKGGALVC